MCLTLVCSLAAAATAQYQEPEFAAPWIGYEINVYPRGIEIWDSAQGDFDRDGHPRLRRGELVHQP